MDEKIVPVNFTVYDTDGRMVKELRLNNLTNTVNTGACSTGVYIWKALTQGQFMQTGKMVVH